MHRGTYLGHACGEFPALCVSSPVIRRFGLEIRDRHAVADAIVATCPDVHPAVARAHAAALVSEPPNGEGANMAMQDGAELNHALAARPDDIEAALAQYEQALFPRSAAAAAVEAETAGMDVTSQDLIDFFAQV